MANRAIRWSAVSLALFLSGCGNSSTPTLIPVTGTITLDGQPLAGASILFQMDNSDRAAFGMTDANGWFALTTRLANDGAPPGQYTVAVRWLPLAATVAANADGLEDVAVTVKPPTEKLDGKQSGAALVAGLPAAVTANSNVFHFKLRAEQATKAKPYN